jgi:AcrR family transcriptional regulator
MSYQMPPTPRMHAPHLAGMPIDARLVSVATEHVRRSGFRRVTVVAVAEEAGMSHANVYRYFRSRTALVDAVTAIWLRAIEADLADIAGAPDPADDKLERMLLALARAMREHLEHEPQLFEAFVDSVVQNRVIARKHRARQRALLERVLDEGMTTNTFRTSDRERALGLILDCLHRFLNPMSVRFDVDMPRATFDVRLAAAIRVVLRALTLGTI